MCVLLACAHAGRGPGRGRSCVRACCKQQLLLLLGGARTGWPMHTGQMLVFGSSPYWLAQLQKALVRVSSCTCVSMPITASYC